MMHSSAYLQRFRLSALSVLVGLATFSTGCTNLNQSRADLRNTSANTPPSDTARPGLPLFHDARPMEWSLTLSVQALVEQGKSQRNPDPSGNILPNPPAPGRLVIRFTDEQGGEETHDVNIEARGNTSLDVCSFPKYNILLAKAPESGMLSGMKKIRVGSHCPVSAEDPHGRIGGDVAVWREALAYAFYRAIEPERAFLSRVVQVNYKDSTSGQSNSHPALLIETDGQYLARTESKEHEFLWTGEPLSADYYRALEDWKYDIPKQLDSKKALLVEMFQILIANRDYGWLGGAALSMERRSPFDWWNVLLEKGNDEKLIAVPKDFDLAGIVSGHTKNVQLLGAGSPLPGTDSLQTLAIRHANRLRQVYSLADISSALGVYSAKKAELEGLILKTLPDSDTTGKTLARTALATFYSAMESSLNTAAYLSHSNFLMTIPLRTAADVTSPENNKCSKVHNLFPVEILETQGDFVRVKVPSSACEISPSGGTSTAITSSDFVQEGWLEARWVNTQPVPPSR